MLALAVAIRSERHRYAGKNDREQTAEEEKALRAFERAADRGVVRLDVVPVVDVIEVIGKGCAIRLEIRLLAPQQQAVVEPTAGLDHAGRIDIVHTHEQAGPKSKKLPPRSGSSVMTLVSRNAAFPTSTIAPS